MSTSTKKPLHRFDPETLDLDTMLKRLNLANTRRNWKSLVERAETEGWSCRDFLVSLVAEEIGQRQQTRLQRAARDAHFPFLKTIEDFDFSLQSTLRRQLLGSYLGPELVSEGRNLILLGKSGRGKTHLSVAIAYRAIQNGFTALFRTAAALIEELSVATARGKLREALAGYLQPNVLVVDEVGYLTYGPDAANVLFHVVNERHLRRRPILFTTNKSPLTAWGDVLHDHDLAEAIVDRVLEKGRLIILDGPSYRTRHLELDGARATVQNAATFSGKHRPDFPEPTPEVGMGTRRDLEEEEAGRGFINGHEGDERSNSVEDGGSQAVRVGLEGRVLRCQIRILSETAAVLGAVEIKVADLKVGVERFGQLPLSAEVFRRLESVIPV